jgi:uncharacterized protein
MKSSMVSLYGGGEVCTLDPDIGSIWMSDIAHSLSCLCRFNGHCREFYSVAQHCVLVSQHVPGWAAKWGLLHDASEAYLADVPTPLKRHLAGYSELEVEVMSRVATRFGLGWPQPASVTHWDRVLLATEARDLMRNAQGWPELVGVEPLRISIEPVLPLEAETMFLSRWNELNRAS